MTLASAKPQGINPKPTTRSPSSEPAVARPEYRVTCKAPACKTRFNPIRYDHIYCANSCQRAHHRARFDKSYAAFSDTNYGKWLIDQIHRAGTVEIVTSTLLDSYQVWVYSRLANGFNDPTTTTSNRYEVSHICPVKGRTGRNNHGPRVIGTLDASNIVIAPGSYNRRRSNSWDGKSGHYISEGSLQQCYKVTDATLPESIIAKVAKLVPAEFEELLTTLDLSVNARVIATKKLIKRGIAAPALNALTHEQFKVFAAEHASPPKRQTMINRLAKQPLQEFHKEPALLEALDEAALTEAYKRLYVNSFSRPRYSAYDVYSSGAQGLGLTVHSFDTFRDHEIELWDNLHGMPFTAPDYSAAAFANLCGYTDADISYERDSFLESINDGEDWL